MPPTLDELDDFLSGKADEKTRQRIGDALCTPGDPLRLFVEGARAHAEALTSWPDTIDANVDILAQVQDALLKTNRVTGWQWIAFIVTHLAVWVMWCLVLCSSIDSLFSVPVLGIWLGTGICAVGCLSEAMLTVRRRQPTQGTAWEALSGATAGAMPFFILLLVLVWVVFPLAASLITRHLARTILRGFTLATLLIAFGGSVFGLMHGFGLRSRFSAGNVMPGTLILRWASLSFGNSGGAWVLAVTVGAFWGIKWVETIFAFFTIVTTLTSAILCLEQDYVRSTYRQAGLACLAGTSLGSIIGAYLGLAIYGSPAPPIVVFELILGSAWGGGAISFACTLWVGFRDWQKLFTIVARMSAARILALLAMRGVAIICDVLQGFDKVTGILQSLPMTVSALVTGAYLGWSGKWLAVIPTRWRLSVVGTWHQWTTTNQDKTPTVGSVPVAQQMLNALVLQIFHVYRVMIDAFMTLCSEHVPT